MYAPLFPFSLLVQRASSSKISSGGLENPRAMFSSLCYVERRAVAKGRLHDVWLDVRRLTHRVFLKHSGMSTSWKRVLHRYNVASTRLHKEIRILVLFALGRVSHRHPTDRYDIIFFCTRESSCCTSALYITLAPSDQFFKLASPSL